MLEVKLGFSNNHAAQSNQVRNSHETVYDISDNPNHIQLQEYAQAYQHDIHDAVRHDAFYAEEIFSTALAVVAPADDGGESEQHQTAGQDVLSKYRESRGESCLRQGCAVNVTSPGTADDDGKTSHGADDDGINEGAGHGNQALLSGPFGFCSSCYDRSRA